MRTMTSKELMNANGGWYRFKCSECGEGTHTKFGMKLHILLLHLGMATCVRC